VADKTSEDEGNTYFGFKEPNPYKRATNILKFYKITVGHLMMLKESQTEMVL